MDLRIIHDLNKVYAFLKNKTRYDYIYQLNNLSVSQWGNVVCYGLVDGDVLKEIVMTNINYHIPVLLSASFNNVNQSAELVERIKMYLPVKFYTHMDRSTLEKVFPSEEISDLEEYVNMGLEDHHELSKSQTAEVVRLGYQDLNDIRLLISISYPEAWLDDELLKLKENFGIYVDGKLVSFAGIHAYSESYHVAAIAHVTTHPEYRNRGYAQQVVGALAGSLQKKIKYIGLNVKTDNIEALKCYRKLGFKEFGKFVACQIDNNRY
ncbi:GNAT family N-acetyltransferase [Desulfosporosinus sp. SB140]|uniref:GNAT family N-acetyltransferase n=1 Tax=Desulfosporosinus paludis TaxID=3115649 RepID=UPI00388E102F